ncbi:MAG: hypothetical protein WEC34_07250 [Acidimicrobiia bacterium]
MSVERNDALDELYGVVPEEFVLVRSRLERELRAAGDMERAADIKRRRRPHLAAWTCNQLARTDPDGIAELFEVTGQVATAQQRALGGGDADDLRAATRRRQETLDALVDEGLRLLAGHAPKPAQYREPVTATLDAATLDADAADELRAGRLTQPLLPPAGFGPLDPAFVPGAPKAKPRKPSRREVDKARRELEQARSAAKELAAAADEADAVVTSADLATQSALAHLEEVDRAQARARDGLAEASSHQSDVQYAAMEARRAAREAEAHAQEAKARLEGLHRD